MPELSNEKPELEEIDMGKQYAFNDFTAGQYQEFEVIKINKFNSKQERLLGIDRYHIYNDMPRNKEKSKIGLFNKFKNIFYSL